MLLYLIYYILLYYTLLLLLYLILYYTLLSSVLLFLYNHSLPSSSLSSHSSPSPLLFISSLPSPLFSHTILFLLFCYYSLSLFPSSRSIFHHSHLLLFSPNPLIHSILVGTWIYLFMFSSVHSSLLSPYFSPFSSSSSFPSQSIFLISFYTCRYFDIHIYIL